MDNRLLKKNAQGLLEFCFSFLTIVLLLLGIMQIWFWANNQLAKRQVEYNKTRQIAGFALPDYKLQWPLVYERKELKEDDVLIDLE